jgi:predicted heme/steroid binding protein
MSCTKHKALAASRVIDDKWSLYTQTLHVFRVHTMQPSIDNALPRSVRLRSRVKGTSKKEYQDMDNALRIHRENQLLLRKIIDIETKPSATRPGATIVPLNQLPTSSTRRGSVNDPKAANVRTRPTAPAKQNHEPRRPARTTARMLKLDETERENAEILRRILLAKPTISAQCIRKWDKRQKRISTRLQANSQNRPRPVLPQPQSSSLTHPGRTQNKKQTAGARTRYHNNNNNNKGRLQSNQKVHQRRHRPPTLANVRAYTPIPPQTRPSSHRNSRQSQRSGRKLRESNVESMTDDSNLFNSTPTYTLDELRTFDGRNGKALYVALNGVVFNVSSSPMYYGQGGSYEGLAGRDASRALAIMSLREADLEQPTLEGMFKVM